LGTAVLVVALTASSATASTIVINGGFETGDFTGWNSSVGFVINSGVVTPLSGDAPAAPFDGTFSVISPQSPASTSVLYQDIILPTNAGVITLSWDDRIRNFNPDFETNQQFRVEVRDIFDNRLALLHTLLRELSTIADFSEIVTEVKA